MAAPAWRGRLCGALPGALAIGTMLLSWVAMTELIQGLQNGWKKPWFVTYVIHGGYSLCLIPWAFLHWRRTGRLPLPRCCRRGAPADLPAVTDGVSLVSQRQLLVLCLVLQALSAFNGMTWYLSLDNTLGSLNNAIYQSSSAFVFLLAYFAMGERVTLPKVVSVVLSIVGVCVVSLAPSSDSDDGIVQTVGGYLWCLTSTIGYAVYEVIYGRFTEQRVASCYDIVRRDFVSSHVQPAATAAALDHADGAAAGAAGRGKWGSDIEPAPPALYKRRSSRAGDGAAADSPFSSPVGGGFAASAASPAGTAALLPDTPRTAASTAIEAASVGAPAAVLASSANAGEAAAAAALDQPLLVRSTPAGPAASGGGDHAVLTPVQKAEFSAWFLGTMGIFTLVTLWPVFLVLHYSGVEPLEWPSGPKGRMLALSAALDTLYNVALLFGISVTSPLWMSVGTILVVPATMIADFIVHNVTVGAMAGGGIALILIGFVVMQLPFKREWELALYSGVRRCCCAFFSAPKCSTQPGYC